MITMRKATPADVPGIATVTRDVWGQDILPDVCEEQTHCQVCALYIVEEAGDIAGFVSAFLTVDNVGNRRWEVDLLAVRPASQGQRLGQQMVEAACWDAQELTVPFARAAIRVDNIASQKTFTRAGFKTDEQVHKLLLWSPAHDGSPIIYGGSVTFVPVNTLTYRGLWLEGLTTYKVDKQEQRKAVQIARSLIAWEGRHNIGAMIPAEEYHRLAPDLLEAAQLQGEYYWYTKTIR
jgi:N-acetylglutamate synthase-like GNAT family acetyltransferase